MNTLPPNAPDEMPYLPPEPPQWPKVVGIISIVWASLGLLCAPCGMAVPFFMPMILPPEMTKDGLPPNMQVNPLSLVMQSLGLLMAVLLLAAGVATVKRLASGRTMHLVYAALQFPGLVFGIWVVLRVGKEMTQWAANNPDNEFAKQHLKGGDMGTVIGIAMMVIFGAVYPAFLLIWFGLVKRTHQSMIEPAPAA